MRRWSTWPQRFREQANVTSGLLTLAGAGAAGGGLVLAAPVVMSLGLVFAAGVAGWCAVRAIPPAQRAPQDAVGDRFPNLAELEQFSPPLARVGFLGASRAGKTTLLMHVIAQPAPSNVRTDDPYAIITALVGQPSRYFALIDAAGQQYSQQFKVADESGCLVVCLDHASGDRDPNVDPDRLRQHEEFLRQLLGHLRNTSRMPSTMHFLLNKRDLWESCAVRPDLEHWFDEQVARWSSLPNVQVTSSHHSNFKAEDTTLFIQTLRRFLP